MSVVDPARPGKVVRDLVVLLADGGVVLRHLAVLDGQPDLFGDVASLAGPVETPHRPYGRRSRAVPAGASYLVVDEDGAPVVASWRT